MTQKKSHRPKYDNNRKKVYFRELPDDGDTDDFLVMESSRACTDIARMNGYSYNDTCNCINGSLGCDECPWGNSL